MTALARVSFEQGEVGAAGLVKGNSNPLTFDATISRTGSRSGKSVTQASVWEAAYVPLGTQVIGRRYFACAHVRFAAATGLPTSADVTIASWTSAANQLNAGGALRLKTNGSLGLFIGAGQVGSDFPVVLDQWHRIDWIFDSETTGVNSYYEVFIDGTSIGSYTGTFGSGSTAITTFGFQVGWFGTGTTSGKQMNIDDVGVNDELGSVNNTIIGDLKVYTSHAIADVAIGNWRTGNGGSTNLWDSVNNTPPLGEATSGTTAASQIENGSSSVPSSYDATMQSYSTLGIGAGDTIQCVMPVLVGGNSAATGTDTVDLSVVSNPAIAAATVSIDNGAAGNYPTNWEWRQGNIAEAPTVTLGTSPVMRVTKTVAVTRLNSVTYLALNIGVTPGGVAPTNWSSTDNVTLALTETEAQAASAATADTLAPLLSEVAAGAGAAATADTTLLALSASASQAATAATADDTTLAVTEAGSQVQVTAWSSTDDLTLATSEAAAEAVAAALSDTITLALTEAATQAAAAATADTTTLALTEAAAAAASAATSDSTTLALTEAASGARAAATADAAALVLTESGDQQQVTAWASTDSLALVLTESGAQLQVSAWASTDTLAFLLTQANSLAGTASAADTLALVLSELEALAAAASTADAATLAVTESGAQDISALETVGWSSTDALALAFNENATGASLGSSVDQIATKTTESAGLTGQMLSVDAIALALTEAGSLSEVTQRLSSDTIALALTEIGTTSTAMSSFDTIALQVTHDDVWSIIDLSGYPEALLIGVADAWQNVGVAAEQVVTGVADKPVNLGVATRVRR